MDRINLVAGTETFRGSGALIVTKEQFRLDLTLSGNSKSPGRLEGIWREEDLWKVKGRIEDEILFRATHVSPRQHTSSGLLLVVALEFQTIELIEPKISAKERRAMVQQLERLNLRAQAIPTKSKKPRQIASASFVATLLNVKLLAENRKTTKTTTNPFIGRTRSWSADTFVAKGRDSIVALVRRDGDLEVHMRSARRWKSKSSAEDLARFQAVLDAVGFTHGFNPWPHRLQQTRNGKLILDTLTAPLRLPQTAHAPFDQTLGVSGYPPPIQLVAKFFTKHEPLQEKIRELLFLFRQAGDKGVHFPVRTLALCSLFEGLVRLLFDHLGLEERILKQDAGFAAFLRKRNELVKALEDEGTSGSTASARLAGLLGHSEPLRLKDKFFALCAAFKLDRPTVKRHVDAWASERNALMHGTWRDHDDDFTNQALIAGGINILLLKLFGYSGKMVANRFGSGSQPYLKI